MPMFHWLNNCRRLKPDEGGSIVVEFAIMLPVLMLLSSGLIEVGRAYIQASAVQKGVRAAALFAARAATPLSNVDKQRAENLARTGTVDGSGALLVPGWGGAGATIDITATSTFSVGTQALPIIRVEASVPFQPVLPNVFALTGFGSHTISVRHEQAYVGD